jgi:hypothetical protein
LAKGPNLSGWIRETNEIVRLFHPRDDPWSEHFRWEGALLMPNTKIARVTILVLQMNAPDLLTLRGWMLDDGYLL